MLVYAPGVWDLFHVGHLNFLKQARCHGTRLIVGVPTDEVVLEDKGQLPIIPHQDRIKLIRALACVDGACLYRRLDFLEELERYGPGVLAVGGDWGRRARHRRAEEWMRAHSGTVVRIRRYPLESTTQIKARVRKQDVTV